MIEPTPLKIELLCKHCGTYLQGEWQKYNTGVEIAVDTLPHCCSEDKDEVPVDDRVKVLTDIRTMSERMTRDLDKALKATYEAIDLLTRG